MSVPGEDVGFADAVGAAVAAAAAASGFSGAVRVDHAGTTVLDTAFGLADRRHGIPCTPSTRFGTASGTKTLTALTVLRLVAADALRLDTRVREVLGDDLPLVDDGVTVEHLLAHRSGIGDYFDEEVHTDPVGYVMPVPVHTLATTEDYLSVLDGHPQVFPPGERFVYNNSGYVVLALVAGRVAGTPFEDLVVEQVCRPAGMSSTAFLRSDELPGDVAIGYLGDTGDRTNVLHLPVLGSGDGGMSTTTADVAALWRALFSGLLVPPDLVEHAVRPRPESDPDDGYGLGFWLGARAGVVGLHGADVGASFRSVHDRDRDLTWTVVSNVTDGAWPVARALTDELATAQA